MIIAKAEEENTREVVSMIHFITEIRLGETEENLISVA
jgi:hypothetical protein